MRDYIAAGLKNPKYIDTFKDAIYSLSNKIKENNEESKKSELKLAAAEAKKAEAEAKKADAEEKKAAAVAKKAEEKTTAEITAAEKKIGEASQILNDAKEIAKSAALEVAAAREQLLKEQARPLEDRIRDEENRRSAIESVKPTPFMAGFTNGLKRISFTKNQYVIIPTAIGEKEKNTFVPRNSIGKIFNLVENGRMQIDFFVENNGKIQRIRHSLRPNFVMNTDQSKAEAIVKGFEDKRKAQLAAAAGTTTTGAAGAGGAGGAGAAGAGGAGGEEKERE